MNAQSQASDPRHSAWVAANAGSGKTHVLVQRILRLLLGGTAPQRILCLTFTKAAAAEMSVRLYKHLSRWIAAGDDHLGLELSELGEPHDADNLAAARRLFARVLETPGGLKIQTIHAFCERLLQQFPVEAGLAPGFTVIEEAEAEALREACRRAVLEDADPGLAAARAVLAAHTDGAAFGDLIKRITSRGRKLDLSPGAAQRLARALELDAGDTAEATARALASLGPGDWAAAVLALESTGKSADRNSAGHIRVALSTAGADMAAAAIEKLFITGGNEPRKPGGMMTASSHSRHPHVLDLLIQGQQRIVLLQDKRTALEMVAATRALTLLAARAAQLYDDAKRARGAFDFDDLIGRAAALLGKERAADWVLYKLDGGIDHVLVDEAQDTSPAQWDIVRALTAEFFAGEGVPRAPRSMFAVGDRKQSIYSFQGADPAAFDAARKHFEKTVKTVGQRFVEAPLTTSFRSSAPVLQAVDATFNLSPARDGVTERADEAIVHEPRYQGLAGCVEIWPPVMPEPKPEAEAWSTPARGEAHPHPTAKLAANIAAAIAEWLNEKRPLPARGRPVTPGDIMILLRRRGALADALLTALTERGVPVAGADRLVLSAHAAAADLVTLARAALLPEDDLSLAELLKSPLCLTASGAPFTDGDLFGLAHGRGKDTLWSRLQASAEHAGITAEIGEWREWALALPPFEFFARVLAAGRPSGRMRLARRLGSEIADPLEAFLDQALGFERAGTASLLLFLDWFEAGGAEIKRDLEHGRDEVRIMTVHGAKGLEANIVFLADTWSPPKAVKDERIRFVAAGGGAPLPLWVLPKRRRPAAADALIAPEMEKQIAEYRRLLYVAMTRAAHELYICAAATGKSASPESWYSLATAALCGGVSPQVPMRAFSAPQTGPKKPEDARAGASSIADEPPWHAWRALEPVHAVPPSRPSAPRRSAHDPAIGRGRFIHRLLHVLADEPAETRAALALRLAVRQGYAPADAEEALRVLASPAFAQWTDGECLAEAEIAGRLPDGREISGRADRLTITDTEVRVLDFKTAAHPPESLAQAPPDDIAQLRDYASLLAAAFPARRIRAALFWTAVARVMEVQL